MLAAFAAVLTVLIGVQARGTTPVVASRQWSIVVHIEYPDGSVYEHAFATGVPTDLMPSSLEACGRSHWTGSAFRVHCYPVPE